MYVWYCAICDEIWVSDLSEQDRPVKRSYFYFLGDL